MSQPELAHLRRLASALGSRLWARFQRDSLHRRGCGARSPNRRVGARARSSHRRVATGSRRRPRTFGCRDRGLRARAPEQLVRSASERREVERRYEQELTDLEQVLEDEQKEEEVLRTQLEANTNALAQLRGSKVLRYTEGPRMIYARYLALRSGNGQGPSRPFDLGGLRARHHARAIWPAYPSRTGADFDRP